MSAKICKVRTELSKRGFTLIELMMVITIIAVLMAIILPNMTSARYRDLLVSCESNERSLAASLEVYNTQFKRYPQELGKLVPLYSKEVWCPTNKTAYVYEVDGDGKNYTLSCAGIHHLCLPGVEEHYPKYSPECGLMENSQLRNSQQK